MKCANCACDVHDDAVHCGGCDSYFDFTCANVKETTYRKYGPDKKAAWRCSECKASTQLRSQASSPSGTTSLDSIFAQLQSLQTQLASLPGLVADVKTIKAELSDLKTSSEYNSAKLEEFGSRLLKVEDSVSEVDQVKESLKVVSKDFEVLKQTLDSKEQWMRLNNVEIKGVPVKSTENLFSIASALGEAVGYAFPKSQINYISRVPTYDPKEKNIILTFVNRYVKEEFIAAARAKKEITASDIGLHDSAKRIYVNDHLTANTKKLLTATKAAAKDKGYQYVWVKYAKIHIRKNDTSPAKVVSTASDLNKIV